MKKIIFLSIIINLFTFFSFGQKSLSGYYYNKTGGRIIVISNNDSLKLINSGGRGSYDWIEAECTFNWVDNNFIEINSTPPHLLIEEGFNIKQYYDFDIAGERRLSFSFPNYKGEFEISISADFDKGFKIFDFKYSEKNREFILPNNTNSITVTIFSPVKGGELDGIFYGFLHCNLVTLYEINKMNNRIIFEVPAIDKTFFLKYFVKGEYARVTKDSIIWKGEVFVKEKKRISW